MCQQEAIDGLHKCSFNGVTETKAWLEWAKKQWGVSMREEGSRAGAEEAVVEGEFAFQMRAITARE